MCNYTEKDLPELLSLLHCVGRFLAGGKGKEKKECVNGCLLYKCVHFFSLAGTSFQRLIPDEVCGEGGGVDKVLFCSGKIYYELINERKSRGLMDKVAILRVEQVNKNVHRVYTCMYVHAFF